jgi:phosphoglycerate dehydrogenase-like enzyme
MDDAEDERDSDPDPDVVVLRQALHGMPVEEYVAALRDRLPDRRIAPAPTGDAARDLLARARVATGISVDRALLPDGGRLELFACAYAGTDHLPVGALRERGIAVTNAAGVHGPNVAEHAVGALLAFTRRFGEARRRQRRREWRHFRTGELQGDTVAVVGMGAIGTAILERLAGFGVERIGVRHTPAKGGPAEEVVGYDGFDGVLARADALLLACPLTDETRGLVDDRALTALDPDAVLVNVARGPVVDTDALVAALRADDVGGAALDVTDPEPLPEDHPLWTFGNVLITPHNAGHTPRYYERLADVVAGNVRRLGEGEPLENRVV